MNDRELLEAAARAAGYTHLTEWAERITDWDSPHHGESALHAAGAGGQCRSWNPMADDGDALRLAVKLHLRVLPYPGDRAVRVTHVSILDEIVSWGTPQDPAAATRRAIVRAAAAMGERDGTS